MNNFPKIQNSATKVWLDSKVNDSSILTKYEQNEDSLPSYFNKSVHLSNFQRYYNTNDGDVQASDKFYTSLLKNIRETDKDSLKEDKQLNFLNRITEKYRETPGINNENKDIDILIPPNTNRHHTNFLFKQLVDYSDNNKFFYKIDDKHVRLIDPNLKEAFYQFCYNNTHKETLR
jgi:hypothetical protein